MISIGYYFVLFLIHILTILPPRVLYIFSDGLYLMVYYLFGYRKKMVRENIRQSFPEKSLSECLQIEKGFYHHFCDILFETISMNGWHRNQALKMIRFKNPEIIDQIYRQKKHIVCLCAHHGNWELTSLFKPYMNHVVFGVYKPLHNKIMDRLMIRSRGNYGIIPVAMQNLLRTTIEYDKQQKPVFIYLLADQRPPRHIIDYWLSFMGREVPVIEGPEKIARKFDCPVVYMHFRAYERGKYEVIFSVLTEEPKKLKEHELVKSYYQKVEETIRDNPSQYLWSHNRWKISKDQYTG